MGKVIATIVFIVFVSFLAWSVINAPKGMKGDYSAQVEVAKPDEIENAISNVVSDVRKRDFVPIRVGVVWTPVRSCYSVTAKGITRDKLINHKP